MQTTPQSKQKRSMATFRQPINLDAYKVQRQERKKKPLIAQDDPYMGNSSISSEPSTEDDHELSAPETVSSVYESSEEVASDYDSEEEEEEEDEEEAEEEAEEEVEEVEEEAPEEAELEQEAPVVIDVPEVVAPVEEVPIVIEKEEKP